MAEAVFDDGQVGSVGSLMGAALETCGHYLQSQVLDVFETNLAMYLGMLLFLIAGVAAIFIIAIGGQYKFSFYFLIGPALFYQATLVRVPSIGASWSFGYNDRPYSEVHNAVNSVASETSVTPAPGEDEAKSVIKEMRVSWFFALWSDFTSNIIQTFINLLRIPELRAEITFKDKVERYVQFYFLRVSDPEIMRFITLMYKGRCSNYFRTMQSFWSIGTNSVQKKTQLKPKLEQYAKKVAFGKGDEELLFKTFDDMGFSELLCRDFEKNPSKSPFESCPVDEKPVLKDKGFTCRDVWALTISALKIHGQELIETLVTENLPKEYDSSGKLIPEEKRSMKALVKLLQKFKQTNYGTEESGVTPNSITDDEAAIYMLNELSARLMVNALKSLDPDIAQEGVGLNSLPQIMSHRVVDSNVASSLRLINDGRVQWWDKGYIYSIALALPYVQGILLYWLAASYPFFALALVVPGRYTGFTLWMGFWFWAKSWDFGFAVVMLIDEFLYVLFPHGPPIEDSNLVLEEDGSNLENFVLGDILNVDPMHSISLYYQLLGACMVSIPIITGILIKRGGGEILSAVNNAIDSFGGTTEQSMSAFYGSIRSQDFRGEAQRHQAQAAMDAGIRSIASNPAVRENLAQANMFYAKANSIVKDWENASSSDKKTLKNSMIQNLREEGLSGVANALSMGGIDEFKDIASSVLRAKGDQHKNIAFAHINRDMQYARWHEAGKASNRNMASNAVMLRYYSHDFTPPPPIEADLRLSQARVTCDIASVADRYIVPWMAHPKEMLEVIKNRFSEGAETTVNQLTGKVEGTEGRRRHNISASHILPRERPKLGGSGRDSSSISNIRTNDPSKDF